MSHFSVLVAIPAAYLEKSATPSVYDCLEDIMAPYFEGTDNPAYLRFADVEDKGRTEYYTDTCHAVRFPDGHIEPAHSPLVRDCFIVRHDGLFVNDKHSAKHSDEELTEMLAHSEMIPNYPCKLLYPTFEEYMESYRGYSNDNHYHRYGYFSNPQAEWDWYQIGGRWPGTFLVKDGNEDYISSEDSGEDFVIEGYTPCSGARKKDICWEKMKSLAQEELRAQYCERCDVLAGLSPTVGFMRIVDGSLYGWDEYPLLKAGESVSEFLERNRAGEEDFGFPGFFAFIDTEGNWHSQGDTGWWGTSFNNKTESDWNSECREFVEQCDANTVLVMVDCHI